MMYDSKEDTESHNTYKIQNMSWMCTCPYASPMPILNLKNTLGYQNVLV